MSTAPLVSVLINNYNYEEFIEVAICSVLNQTYQTFELIIVDDGSTDNSRDIIDSFVKKDSRIFAIYQDNGGQLSAVNTGYLQAKGSIIAFLDADDFFYPEMLQAIVLEHKNSDIVATYFTSNGEYPVWEDRFHIDYQENYLQYGYIGTRLILSNISYSRDIMEKFMPFSDFSLRYSADGIILLCAMNFSKVRILKKTLCFYRVHNNSSMARVLNTPGKHLQDRRNIQHLVNKHLKDKGYLAKKFDEQAYYNYIIQMFLGRKIKSGNKPIAIYGAGFNGYFLKRALDLNRISVFAFFDSQESKWGTIFEGIQVLSPVNLLSRRNEFELILISSVYENTIAKDLNLMGLKEQKDYLFLPL